MGPPCTGARGECVSWRVKGWGVPGRVLEGCPGGPLEGPGEVLEGGLLEGPEGWRSLRGL